MVACFWRGAMVVLHCLIAAITGRVLTELRRYTGHKYLDV